LVTHYFGCDGHLEAHILGVGGYAINSLSLLMGQMGTWITYIIIFVENVIHLRVHLIFVGGVRIRYAG
jgi:hypothetical protein